jgi:hypothetical protein
MTILREQQDPVTALQYLMFDQLINKYLAACTICPEQPLVNDLGCCFIIIGTLRYDLQFSRLECYAGRVQDLLPPSELGQFLDLSCSWIRYSVHCLNDSHHIQHSMRQPGEGI